MLRDTFTKERFNDIIYRKIALLFTYIFSSYRDFIFGNTDGF